MLQDLIKTIDYLWDQKDQLSPNSSEKHKTLIQQIITLLDKGEIRVAEKTEHGWTTHEWVKKVILLYFRIQPNQLITGGPNANWFDKIPLKTQGWTDTMFEKAGFRMVPPATIRYGAFVAPRAVIMPSYINIGAHIGEGTMIDTWATVGSCAQIGKNVHLSGGAGIGGVLEPLQANPTIIEDDCFIGARSEIAEGVVVEQGSVIAMGTFISASTKIINRQTGEIHYGRVPAYSVVVPGTVPSSDPSQKSTVNLSCAVIVKQVDEKTKSKTSINELLRHD